MLEPLTDERQDAPRKNAPRLRCGLLPARVNASPKQQNPRYKRGDDKNPVHAMQDLSMDYHNAKVQAPTCARRRCPGCAMEEGEPGRAA